MWVSGRFVEAEHRRKADVAVLQERAPLVPCPGFENLGQPAPGLGPGLGIVLPLQQLIVAKVEALQQLGVELRLPSPQAYVAAVCGLVHVVKRGTQIEDVGARHVGPETFGPQSMEEGREQGHAVDHAGIYDLAPTRPRSLEQRAQDADDEEHPAAAEVAQQIERRVGRFARPDPQGVERTRQRHVVDVMAWRRRIRALLSPTGDAGVDQPGIALEAGVRAQSETLDHSRAKALYQHVGRLDEP